MPGTKSLFDTLLPQALRQVATWLDDEITRDRTNWEIVASAQLGRFVYLACRKPEAIYDVEGMDRVARAIARISSDPLIFAVNMWAETGDATITVGRLDLSDPILPPGLEHARVIAFSSKLFTRLNRDFFRTGEPSSSLLRSRRRREMKKLVLKTAGNHALFYLIPVVGQAGLVFDVLCAAAELAVLPVRVIQVEGTGDGGYHPVKSSFAMRRFRDIDAWWGTRKNVVNRGMGGLRPWKR